MTHLKLKFFAADFALQNSIFGIYDLLQWFRKIGYIGLEIKNAQISESEDTYRTIGGEGVHKWRHVWSE